MKRTIVRLLLLLLVLCTVSTAFVACQDGKGSTDTGNNVVTDDPNETYPFPAEITLSDKELNILNFSEYYNAIIYTDTDEYGDNIATKVYDRNAYFYDRYKIDVVEHKLQFEERIKSFGESTTQLTNLRNAGDDIYDITYVSINEQYTLLASGIMTDLTTVSTLNLEADYWDPQLSSSYVLKNGAQYVASSPLNLMPYEMTWLIFFNQDMAEEKGLPDLFEYVRQGEWTIENMLKIINDYGIVTADSISGDYTFDASGNATYGIAVHHCTGSVLLQGFDINFIAEQDEEGKPPYKFSCNNTDAFYKASDLLQTLCTRTTGMAIGSDWEADPDHPEGYVPVFNSGRALFLNAELKSGMTLKKILNSEVYYGMLPLPKYSTDQKSYYTTAASAVMLFGIPVMNDEKEATGLAADVLSYLSYRDVLPVYYNDYVTHRNASDAESLEMLNDYIMPGRRLDIGIIYGWTKSFTETYEMIVYKQTEYGGSTIGNIITNNTRNINSTIREFFGLK